MIIRCAILLIFAFNWVISAQTTIPIKDVKVDSLVEDVEYAKKFLLCVDDKIALIDSLLNYEGDLSCMNNWQTNFYRMTEEEAERSSAMYVEPEQMTNQAIALFLIQGIIENEVLFLGISRTYPLVRKKIEGEYRIQALYSYNIRKLGENRNKSILNREHFKKMFRYYKRWFKKIKRLNLPFEEIPEQCKSPLAGTSYAWSTAGFKKSDKGQKN